MVAKIKEEMDSQRYAIVNAINPYSPTPHVAHISHQKSNPGKPKSTHYQYTRTKHNSLVHHFDQTESLSPNSHLENTRPDHNIMKLFQSHTRTQPSTPIRLQNHILEQIIINRILLQLARNAPQMTQ
jgi:hypothetical protein